LANLTSVPLNILYHYTHLRMNVKINLSLIKEGSRSGLGNTLKYLSNKYRFENKCTTHVLKNVLHSLNSRQLNVDPERLKLVANQVRELLNMRDIGNQVLTVGEIVTSMLL
jgi:hypothetical protein